MFSKIFIEGSIFLGIDNILIEKTDLICEMQYKIGDLDFSVQSIGRTIFLWDFDFACIEGVIDNKKCYKAWKNGYNIVQWKK